MSPTLCQSDFVLGSYTDLFHREQKDVSIPELVTKVTNGQRGRPQQSICLDFLTEVVTNNSRHINLSELARILGIGHMTLWRNMWKHGLKRTYTLLSNNELDLLVRMFKRHKPESGFRYLLGHLRRQGIRVQRKQIWQLLRRVDRLGQHLRERRVIQRRVYRVKRSNALWHIDGHHKLIRWGFVIHGIIDGYVEQHVLGSLICSLVGWSYGFNRLPAYEQVQITMHQPFSMYSLMHGKNMVCHHV